MILRKRLACSFCRKGQADVAKLVAGPKVFICDKCVAIAVRLMEGPSADERQRPFREPGVFRKLWDRIWRARELCEA